MIGRGNLMKRVLSRRLAIGTALMVTGVLIILSQMAFPVIGGMEVATIIFFIGFLIQLK